MHGALVGVGRLRPHLVPQPLRPAPGAWPSSWPACTGAAIAGLVSVTGLRLRGAQLVIVTLAFSQAASEWLFQFRGTRWTLARPSGLTDDRWFFAVLLVVTVAFHGVAFLLRNSAWGRMLAATARSETVAQHFGTHTHLVRFQAWALSGFMAATAGAFYALYLTAIKPSDFGVLLSISLLLYLICCGRASLFAPALVGLIFVFGPEVFKFSQTGATAIPSIVSGLAVVAVLALFPSGLADLIARGKARPVLRDAFRPGRPGPSRRPAGATRPDRSPASDATHPPAAAEHQRRRPGR